MLGQFLRFGAVGAAGFLVDAGTLLAVLTLGGKLFGGRVVSFLCAATFTWYVNRRFTFAAARNGSLVLEWMRFVAANSFGGALNLAVYFVLVSSSAWFATWPAAAVAFGSTAGLGMNFLLSRTLVFRSQTSGRH